MAYQRSMTQKKREKRWKWRENQSRKRSFHSPFALVWSVSKHEYFLSMDPIFDLATKVMQVCAFVFPTELHLSHFTSREGKVTSGEDTHLSDIERSNKRVRPRIILYLSKSCKKIPNLQQNMEGAWIRLFQSSTVQNGKEEIQRFIDEGKVLNNFCAGCLYQGRVFSTLVLTFTRDEQRA